MKARTRNSKIVSKSDFQLRRTLSIDDNICRLKAHVKRLRRTACSQRMARWVRLRQRLRPTLAVHRMQRSGSGGQGV